MKRNEIAELGAGLGSFAKWSATAKSKIKKWKPRVGDKYFYIELGYHEGFFIDYDRWAGYGSVDTKHYRLGNCFRTRKEAEVVLKKLKKLLRENNG